MTIMLALLFVAISYLFIGLITTFFVSLPIPSPRVPIIVVMLGVVMVYLGGVLFWPYTIRKSKQDER